MLDEAALDRDLPDVIGLQTNRSRSGVIIAFLIVAGGLPGGSI